MYQYNDNGKFIKEYESISEVRDDYYPDDVGKRPMFRKRDVEELPDGTFIAKNRIGRVGIRKFLKRYRNPFINRHSNYESKLFPGNIEVYNLDNECIATFKDFNLTYTLLKISPSTLSYRLSSESFGRDGLMFKEVK